MRSALSGFRLSVWLLLILAARGAAQPAAPPTAAEFDAKTHFTAAYEAFKVAQDIDSLTRVIEQCEGALAEQKLTDYYVQYAHKLASVAHNRRGELRDAAGKSQEALADFEAAVKHVAKDSPSRASFLHNRAVSYAQAGRLAEARADFDQVLRLNPQFDRAWFNRGELNYAEGKFQEALADYTQAIRTQPNNAAAYTSRGHAQYRLRDYRAALADYNRAIELSPRLPEPYVYRGDGYADLGAYDQAKRDFEQALRLDESSVWALRSLAWLMATCPREEYRDAQRAVELAEKAQRLFGQEHPRLQDTLAAAHANAGDFAKAQAAQKKALELAQAESEDVKKEFAARLARYAEERPYRHLAAPAVVRPR